MHSTNPNSLWILFPSFRLEFAWGRLKVRKDQRSSGKVTDLNWLVLSVFDVLLVLKINIVRSSEMMKLRVIHTLPQHFRLMQKI